MRIKRFKNIETRQLARELTRKVYGLTKKTKFAHNFGLKGQIQDAAGSSMQNIAARIRFEVSSRHTSGGLTYVTYEQDQRKYISASLVGPSYVLVIY